MPHVQERGAVPQRPPITLELSEVALEQIASEEVLSSLLARIRHSNGLAGHLQREHVAYLLRLSSPTIKYKKGRINPGEFLRQAPYRGERSYLSGGMSFDHLSSKRHHQAPSTREGQSQVVQRRFCRGQVFGSDARQVRLKPACHLQLLCQDRLSQLAGCPILGSLSQTDQAPIGADLQVLKGVVRHCSASGAVWQHPNHHGCCKAQRRGEAIAHRRRRLAQFGDPGGEPVALLARDGGVPLHAGAKLRKARQRW